MQSTSCTAARSNREVLLALLVALFLVSAGNRMLEACRVSRVTCDRNVYALFMHNSNALANVVSTVAANVSALTVGVGGFFNDRKLACEVVKLSLNIGKAIDS